MNLNSHLYPYIGYRNNGTLALFVCIAENSIVGESLEKPHPLPKIVKDFQKNPTPEAAIPALEALKKFLAGEELKEEVPVFGETIQKKRRKTC